MAGIAADQTAAVPPRRGRPRSNEAREAILDAAIAVVRELGYSGLSHDVVAARAGVGKATIYRRWPTRAQLGVAALRYHAPAPGLEPTGDTRADIQNLIAASMATMADYGELIAALALDAANDSTAGAELAAHLGPHRATHAALLLSAAGRGELPHDIDTKLVLDLIAGTLLYRQLLEPRAAPDTGLARQLADLVCDSRLPTTG